MEKNVIRGRKKHPNLDPDPDAAPTIMQPSKNIWNLIRPSRKKGRKKTDPDATLRSIWIHNSDICLYNRGIRSIERNYPQYSVLVGRKLFNAKFCRRYGVIDKICRLLYEKEGWNLICKLSFPVLF